ncbi:MAG: hypothetical protein LJE96_09490 [Deltaproteobacteria bacterium]|nr:hypothetical protein [Deltaproteobacteria bacterium]
MRKSILYTLFRMGRLPKDMAQILEGEGIVLLDEGIPGSITLRNFRAPGRIHGYKKTLFAGSLVVTELRFAAFAFSRPMVNVPLGDPKLNLLDITIDRRKALMVKFDAHRFHEEWKGTVELRFASSVAHMFVERLSGSVRSEAIQ